MLIPAITALVLYYVAEYGNLPFTFSLLLSSVIVVLLALVAYSVAIVVSLRAAGASRR